MAKPMRNIPKRPFFTIGGQPPLRSPFFIGGKPIFFGTAEELLFQQLHQRASSPVRKLSGKEWVPAAYARRPGELLAMGITDASKALAAESKTAPDCVKPLTVGYIKNLLRENGAFPKAYRGRK